MTSQSVQFKPFSEFGKTVFTGGVNFFLKIADKFEQLPNPGLKFSGWTIVAACTISHGLTVLWIILMFFRATVRDVVLEVPLFLYLLVGATVGLLALSSLVMLIGFWLLSMDDTLRAVNDQIQKLQADNQELRNDRQTIRNRLNENARRLVQAITHVSALQLRAAEIEEHLNGADASAALDDLQKSKKTLSALKSCHTKMQGT